MQQALYKRLKDRSVLIAEDDGTTRKWLERILRLYFKEVYSSADAYEAMESFVQHPCDIVIADIRMPEVDGFHLMQQIAAYNPNTLRIVVTAFNGTPYLNRAVESGIHLYLKKPVDIDELLVAIASNLPKPDDEPKESRLCEGYVFRHEERLLYCEGQLVKLTKKELGILELLLKYRSGVVDLVMLEQHVWNEPATPDAIRMVLVGLRKKLPEGLIENLKGLGYRLSPQ